MQPDEGLGQAFTVADQAAEAHHPGEAALDNPAARQKHEAMLGSGQLDDRQADAMCLSIRRRLAAGSRLVNECDFDTSVTSWICLARSPT